MFKILVSDPLAEEGLEILRKEEQFQVDVKTKLSEEQLKETIKDYDALVVRSSTKVTKAVIDSGVKLRVIGRAGVGLDNVDADSASIKGIIVMNSPAGNTMSTAEHAMSLILSISRNIPQANASMKSGVWDRKKFMGVELYNKTLGIIGLGRIGAEVAKRSLSFGMRVIAYDPYLSVEKARQLGVGIVDLKKLLAQSDYITIHTPLTDDTKYLISDEAFKLMKFGVRIINCARGGIIEEAALERAIKSGKVLAAALDVFEEEPTKNVSLVGLEQVVATPHIGASTEEAQLNVSIEIAEQVRDALLGRCIRNAVNVPCVEPEMLKNISPYINLAEKMGTLIGQITDGRTQEVKVRYNGEFTRFDLSSVSIALVKGLLTPAVGDTVNFVNALVIAKERDIDVIESKSTHIEDFANTISLELKTDKMNSSITGTLFTNKDPRIVKINQFFVDAVPSGYMIIISNKDVPGIVGNIGTILGKNNINIAGMTFGREKPGQNAITVLNVDSFVSREILQQLKDASNIWDARLVKL